jgi:methylase of polypeptide subunit release factors
MDNVRSMLMTPQRERLLDDLAKSFAERGIEVLMLRGPNLGVEHESEEDRDSSREPAADPTTYPEEHEHADHRHQGHEIVLLVRAQDAPLSRTILEATRWRFELGDRGPWRIFRTVAYLYDDRLGISLMWAIPGAPLPLPRLGSLERELWAGATRGSHGFLQPAPEPLVVFLATQAARLHIRGPQRYASWTRDLATSTSEVLSWQRVWDVAKATRVEASVRRGLALAGTGGDLGELPGPDGLGTQARWSLAEILIRHAWPRQLRGYAAAAPRLGAVTARARFDGIELDVGRGIFVPRPLAESMVHEAVRVLSSESAEIVVDVGTGCGPVALGIASAIPDVEIHATEISRRALRWAARNRARLGTTNVHLHRGSLLDPLPARLHGRVRVLTANVPYVPREEWQEAWRGRESQVVGTQPDGLGLYRIVVAEARRFLTPDGRIVLQMESRQWDRFADELRDLGYRPGGILQRGGNDTIVWADVATRR